MTGSVIKLEAGPGHGQIYFEADFRDRIRSAHRMGRTEATGPGWALGYTPGPGNLWVWQGGVNCHPADPEDPDLAPYGAAFRGGTGQPVDNANDACRLSGKLDTSPAAARDHSQASRCPHSVEARGPESRHAPVGDPVSGWVAARGNRAN